MMNWNFNLQMFAGFPATPAKIVLTNDASTTAEFLTWSSSGTAATKTVNDGANDVGVLSYNDGDYILTTDNTNAIAANMVLNLKALISSLESGKKLTVTIGAQNVPTTVRFVTNDFDISGTAALATAGSFNINKDGSVTAKAGFTVNSGSLTYASDSTAFTTTLGASATGVSFASGSALATTVITLSDTTTVTLTETAANNKNVTTVDASGNVTGMDTGTVIGTAGQTVTTASAGTFTLGDTTGVAFTVAGDTSVKFTVATDANGGASKVEDVASGATVSFTSTATKPFTMGSETFTEANGVAVVVTSDGTGISDISTKVAAGSFTGYGANGESFTFNKKVLNIQGDADGVTVTTSTSSITNVAGVGNGAIVTVGTTNVAVVADVATIAKDNAFTLTTTNGSNAGTYNFVQGTIGAAALAAGDVVATYVDTTGKVWVTDGTIYLDGNANKSANLSWTDALGATTTMVVETTQGDIAVKVDGAAAGGVTVDDLDNGDTFKMTLGGVTKTYSVINGVLWNTTDNKAVSTAAADVLVSTDAGVRALQVNFTNTATLTAVAAKNATDYASEGTAFDSVDITGVVFNARQTADAAVANITQFGNGNTVHRNGIANGTAGTDGIGTLGYNATSNIPSYTASSSSKAQTITIVGDTNTWSITGSAAGDDITGNGMGSSLDGGAGNDTITASGTDIAYGGEGNDSLVGAGTASLSGGAGKDTLTGNAADVTLTGGDGADVFVLNHGAITDYNFSEDVIYTNLTLANAVTNASFTSAGVVSVRGGTQSVTLGAANEYAVKFKTSDNQTQIVAWAGENSANLDGSSLKDALIISGRTNEVGDSLVGGSKNDTIYAGAGDSVFGGAGSNQISLTGATATETVLFTGAGKDTVRGFLAGFDEDTTDKLIIDGASNLTTTLGNSDLTVKSGTSNMVLYGVATSGVAKVRVGNDKAIFASDTATVKLETLSDANYYYGTKGTTSSSKLDLSAIEESANVDLNNTTVIRNFTSIKGGAGNTTLVGTSANETLASGGGNTSLYGGAGKDVLQGATKVKDSFFMFNGGGNDTVTGFEGYTEDTAETADVVVMEELTSAKLISGGVQLAGKDSDKLFISGANANTEIQFSVGGNAGIAKIGSVSGANSFTYDKAVTYYGGGNAVDTLTFNSSDSDNHEVWLGDSSKGVTYASIDVINASNAGGDVVLAGDSAKQTITGGKGNSSLWGGTGNTADSLKGGAGTNVFFYGSGEGNDTISSANAEDTVNLYNISLSDVKSGEITNAGVSVEFKDGSKLTVATSKDIKFSLASGESYIANHSTKGWDQA